MRNCPVCQVSVAADMLELHVNEHFEAESEMGAMPNNGGGGSVVMGQNAPKQPAQAKSPGFLSRLLGVGGSKPSTTTTSTPVVQSTPPTVMQSPVYTNPNRPFAQQASSYYPQTQMSTPPSGNLYPQQYPGFRAN